MALWVEALGKVPFLQSHKRLALKLSFEPLFGQAKSDKAIQTEQSMEGYTPLSHVILPAKREYTQTSLKNDRLVILDKYPVFKYQFQGFGEYYLFHIPARLRHFGGGL